MVEASTIHACAMRLLRRADDCETNYFFDDEKMKAYIARTCNQEIATFLGPCFRHIRRSTRDRRNFEGTIERKQKNAEKQVMFFLLKTLTNFCRSKMSVEDFQNPRTFGRSYYPGRHCLYGPWQGVSKLLELTFLCSSSTLSQEHEE